MTSSDMLHLICSALSSSFSLSRAVCKLVSPFPFVSRPRPFYSGCFCLLGFSFFLCSNSWPFRPSILTFSIYSLVSNMPLDMYRLCLWLHKRYWSSPSFTFVKHFFLLFQGCCFLLLFYVFVLIFKPFLSCKVIHILKNSHITCFLVDVSSMLNTALVGFEPVRSSVGSFPSHQLLLLLLLLHGLRGLSAAVCSNIHSSH